MAKFLRMKQNLCISKPQIHFVSEGRLLVISDRKNTHGMTFKEADLQCSVWLPDDKIYLIL